MFAQIVIFTILGLFLYLKRRQDLFVFLLCVVSSDVFNFFALNQGASEIIIFLLVIIIFFIEILLGNKDFLSVKDDIVGKVILILLLYYFIIMMFTIINKFETPMYAFRVFNNDIFYLYYFIFRRLKLSECKKTFKLMFFFSVIGGIFFYLQFAGITGILVKQEMDLGYIIRYGNAPLLTIPFAFYLIFSEDKIRFRTFWIMFFMGLLILPLSRARILVFIIIAVFYFFKNKSMRHQLKIWQVTGFVVIIFLFFPIISDRFGAQSNQGNTAFGEINEAFRMEDYKYTSKGTFVFRMGILRQRMEYMFNHPQTFITGIGTIHEDSPNNRLNFSLGTALRKDTSTERSALIETNDIAFVTHILRYGLIYFILFGILLVSMLKRLWHQRDNSFVISAYFCLLMDILLILSGDQFSTFKHMFYILIGLGAAYQLGYKSKPRSLSRGYLFINRSIKQNA